MKKSFKKPFIVLILVLLASSSLNAQAVQLDIQPVLSTDKAWNQAALPPYTNGVAEMHVLKFTIAPGGKTPIHLHPVNGAGYVLSGELTMYSTSDTGGNFSDPRNVKKIILKPGDAWAETVNTWHYGINDGEKNVEFVLVFAGQKGTPTAMSLGTYSK